ncbi:MAG: prolipoprotein diacylglyceryl transferase [Treponema sp.]|nr:prolipoprotein diacylglyceryl transferase [Treponema sp.]
MIVTGILSGAAICKKLCAVQNLNFYDFIIISAVAGAFGFAGAKIFFLFDYYSPALFFKSLGYMLFHPKESGLISGGFVFYGGLIGGIAGYFLGVKIAHTKVIAFLNTYAFAIPFVHAFGRIGCFCAGCCYGMKYEGPLAVHYNHPVSDVPAGQGCFPVQLLESLLLFAFSIVILLVIFKRAKDNFSKSYVYSSCPLFLYYILYYSIVRFLLEFLRGDEIRGQIKICSSLTLSISQIVSLILFAGALIIIVLIKTRKNDKVEITEIQND